MKAAIMYYLQKDMNNRTHHFVPVVVETSCGTFGTEASDLFTEIGRHIQLATQEVRARSFLIQQVSVAIQRGTLCPPNYMNHNDCISML